MDKILKVDDDPKGSRVATTVFINKATKEDAVVFLDYLDHSSPGVKKMARHIVGQKGLTEAIDKLLEEFYGIVGNLTFMPDEEYKEKHFYVNIIEILETIFAIVNLEKVKNEELFKKIDEIFKRTRNEDLRFTLIKLIGVLGDRLDYFLKIFDDLTEKEKRALYYVYTQVEHPRSIDVFKKGLEDDRNFDYVVANLLSFDAGKKMLGSELLNMGNYNKQAVLKKLQQGKYPEFNEALLTLLSDKNKYLVELAIDNLKRSISSGESLQPFIDMIETGYSPEGISGALEIIAHFVKKNPEDIYIQGLEKQPSHKNKTLILDFFIEKLKTDIKVTESLTEKVLPKLLAFFDNYTKEKEDLFISVFKIIASLQYPNSGKVKGLKSKMIGFKKEYEIRLSTTFKNNFNEFMVKLNQMIARFEESENKVKNISVLFDIDASKIDHGRMMKMKEQIAELDFLDEETKSRLVTFLAKVAGLDKLDWKVRTVALDLLGEHGGPKEIGVLNRIVDTESSLAVKTNAQKALKKIEEEHAADIECVLVMEPLFYIRKKLSEFLKNRAFRVFDLDEVSKFPQLAAKKFKFIVVSENLLTPDLTQELFNYVDDHMDSHLIIVTAQPDKWESYKDLPNIRFLKKPFSDQTLLEVVSGN